MYSNDFESGNLAGITSGTIALFNGTHVLGRYNSGGFNLTVPNLPKHDLVEITFDLYIHDTWDGNNLDSGYSGPDLWSMLVDGNSYIHTSFSNSDCGVGVFCPPQSYPDNYLNSNHNPKAGAFRTDLPGACYLSGSPNGTTEYKISKTISHSSATLLLQCIGDLVQKNVSDPLCDESWSVDNINIKAITL
ncbi:hypothetical protein RG47T_2387 [Mucilaginibacter polytrichastri]|uniref:Uncharacterized protein n=1 Tax=Mucilaginibacter polytrichastri TaxID=1302689 RepID=A0A1Q5ZYV6_9SPHI|nr:hypothetical protein RG47T_2387 [Mucilaginibacter polytrichastri]